MSGSVPDCIFCKIVAGDIPAEVLARNDHAVAFRDVNPQAPFHALVVPVDHQPDAAASAAADPAVLGHMVTLADEVANASGNEDYRLVANTGAGAGQSVFHTHLHVLGATTSMTETLV
ncbi:HIT domain-containing protein [Nocardioides sp. SYSU D00065]|uniref:HIT domain-containing protein n=1 Tax=Nocardioides sp. SYSU D00065 TaxID=2817378 RepID=UPI001B31CDA3|nr:HIT domain-containing protein [Nocardioides sp. SYSU D00065]